MACKNCKFINILLMAGNTTTKCIHHTYGPEGGGWISALNISYIVFGPGGWGVAQIFVYAH